MTTTTTANKVTLRKDLAQARKDLKAAKAANNQPAAKKARRQIRVILNELEHREAQCYQTNLTF